MAGPRRDALREMHFASSDAALVAISAAINADATHRQIINQCAAEMVTASRCRSDESGTLDSFLREFGLSNSEGIALMCLAEALLRVPDQATIDSLISEKINEGNWGAHKNASDSKLVNASVWGLMLAGKVIGGSNTPEALKHHWLSELSQRLTEPVVRLATLQAMKILGGQFVLGRNIPAALARSASSAVLCSFDMLGEGARTQADAERYFDSYKQAINTVGQNNTANTVSDAHGISVKLSALHPRFLESQRELCLPKLKEKVLALAELASHYGLGLSLDAEECSRLELTLDVFEWLCDQPSLASWGGLGFVLQAYQKRGLEVAIWLTEQAMRRPQGVMVRLVKGAYWDTEIKIAQQKGLEDYPVFTNKIHTDLSYEACAATLFSCPRIYCQFATHNALTIAQILQFTSDSDHHFELQKLHGMGDLLYAIVSEQYPQVAVRTYAPVGQHEDLLPYLVRRLLENGANSSFVNRFLDSELPVATLVEDPLIRLTTPNGKDPAHIPIPRNIFSNSSPNWLAARGADLDARPAAADFEAASGRAILLEHSTLDPDPSDAGLIFDARCPATGESIGSYAASTLEDVDDAVMRAHRAFPHWSRRPVGERADLLNRVGDLLEANTIELTALIAREAGRTLNDGLDEVREAVDFCRYYAAQAEALLGEVRELPGVTGETNQLRYSARGVWLCISPWNFPLAIFVGQIAANLAVGNTVVAKPAEQTPLVARFALHLFAQAGIESDVLSVLYGDGPSVGAPLVDDTRVRGVSFTGSHTTALTINRQLAHRTGPITPFIAETGGINCMFVDSTALPEQVIDDVITSAFRSAGQRCSALRVLFLQREIADKTLAILEGAMHELIVGDPRYLATDVGPVIDDRAKEAIDEHLVHLDKTATLRAITPFDRTAYAGHFIAPQVWEIDALADLTHEVFGPVLHVIRYDIDDLPQIFSDIRASEFALTMGVHSRLRGLHERIREEALVGNLYINRDTVGAVVGSHPFGGHGVSGTGPKAGGPNYLKRLVNEHTVTDNITALGGNTALFNLE